MLVPGYDASKNKEPKKGICWGGCIVQEIIATDDSYAGMRVTLFYY
jgi:hypothetical protein